MASTSNKPIGRYSSQYLRNLGAQKKVQTVNGELTNTFQYNRDLVTDLPVGSTLLGNEDLEPAFTRNELFHTIQAYYQARGASLANAQTMTLLAFDTSNVLNINPYRVVEDPIDQRTGYISVAYGYLNLFRTPSDEQNLASDINNGRSRLSRQIKP